MGIKSNYNGFLKTITKNNPIVFDECSIEKFKGCKVAIDTMLFLCKFKASMGDSYMDGFTTMILTLRRFNVHPVFVFDGEAPDEKRQEQLKRREDKAKLSLKIDELFTDYSTFLSTGFSSPTFEKFVGDSNIDNSEEIRRKLIKKRNQCFSIRPEEIIKLKIAFSMMMVPFIVAPGEGEKFCVHLCNEKHVVGVISDDTDILAYCVDFAITNFKITNGWCTVVEHKNVMQALQFDDNKTFVDHCIMCGTDFNKNIPRIGAKKAYDLIVKFKSIEGIAENTNHDISILNHVRVRELLTSFAECFCTLDIPYCGYPDWEEIKGSVNDDIFTNDFYKQLVSYRNEFLTMK